MEKLLVKYKNYINNNPSAKKTIGVVLIVLGLLALVTPLTPGSWLALLGLELIGVRFAITDRIMEWAVGKKTV